MSDGTEAGGYTVHQFIDDVKVALKAKGATDAGLGEIAGRLKILSARDDLFEQGEWRDPTPGGNSIGSYRLHTKPDESLVLSVSKFSHERSTPVHTHDTWGVICGYQGRDHYEGWERIDDGSKPGHARLKPVVDRYMERGDALYWLEHPKDIHRQQALGEPAWELILLGRSTSGIARLHFDPDQDRVWPVEHGNSGS